MATGAFTPAVSATTATTSDIRRPALIRCITYPLSESRGARTEGTAEPLREWPTLVLVPEAAQCRWSRVRSRAVGRKNEGLCRPPQGHRVGHSADRRPFRVRRDRIDSTGNLTLRHNSRLHHIGIGRRHASLTVLVLVHDLHIRVPPHQRTTTPGPDPRPEP